MSNGQMPQNDNHTMEMAPPKTSIGLIGWMKQNLFSSWSNSLLSILFGAILYYIVAGTLRWVFIVADWRVIEANFRLLAVGQYTADQLWRVWLSLTLFSLLSGLTWGIWRGLASKLSTSLILLYVIVGVLPFITGSSKIWLLVNVLVVLGGYFLGNYFPRLKRITIIGWLALFPITIFLLSGFGLLPEVGTNLWGGFLLTILISMISIVFSFPIGVLLALGRRSNLPIIKWFSIAYIELIRGVPLISVLFMAQIMIPLFLPDIRLDNVLRAMIAFTLFNAAYLAENVRGGLQSIPRSQYEAAQALGLSKTVMVSFVILPQALRAVIPALVGQSIAVFKDTSLVAIVGLIDLLGIGRFIVANPQFLGRQMEVFLFIAFVYWIFAYSMSYASRRLEKSLGVGER